MIYLDNAATTLHKPQEVINAVVYAMGSLGNAGRGISEASLKANRTVFDTREKISSFFGASSPNRIAFTSNSTESLNIAIRGVLSSGDHVITTAMEHNSVLRPLYYMESEGVEVTIIPCDDKGAIDIADIKKAIKHNTKAIVCTNGSNVTGNYVEIGEIGKIAEENNVIFIVDASQTAGVFPIDVEKQKVDILCFTGHKGLLGPQGTGGIYLREGINIRPIKCGGSGVDSYNKAQPESMPTLLEAGTLNGHGLSGLSAAIDYINSYGMEKIRNREQELMWKFYEAVVMIPNVKIYGDFSSKYRCPIVSLNIEDMDSAELSDILLQDYGISTRSGAHCAPLVHIALGTKEQGAVRFSFSYTNSDEDVEAAINAIKELAEE